MVVNMWTVIHVTRITGTDVSSCQIFIPHELSDIGLYFVRSGYRKSFLRGLAELESDKAFMSFL